jgi:hypothetical protein
MSYTTSGINDKPIYGCCETNQRNFVSTAPFDYQMYFGKEENCRKCTDGTTWYKQNPRLVNIESDLRNQTRPQSRCEATKYNYLCNGTVMCDSTFDPTAPRIYSPSLCPIVYNNIKKPTSNGFNMPDFDVCNLGIKDKNAKGKQINMFLSNCKKEPLYNGGTEYVSNFNAY